MLRWNIVQFVRKILQCPGERYVQFDLIKILEIETKSQSQESFTWSWYTKYWYKKYYENISFVLYIALLYSVQ